MVNRKMWGFMSMNPRFLYPIVYLILDRYQRRFFIPPDNEW